MASRSITKFLTSPSKVAHALDWRKVSGSILSMTVAKDKIMLAIASHPSFEDPLQQLPSIPLETETVGKKKVLKSKIVDELSSIVNDFHVCGMVVSWPVQKEGWCGSSCGRVLHTLDQLTAQSKTLLTSNRPICLWDEEHNLPNEDEWGRAPIYSKSTDKTFHLASKEQYVDHDSVALDVWNDFCRAHWPEIYYQEHQQAVEGKDSSSLSSIDPAFIEPPKKEQYLNQAFA